MKGGWSADRSLRDAIKRKSGRENICKKKNLLIQLLWVESNKTGIYAPHAPGKHRPWEGRIEQWDKYKSTGRLELAQSVHLTLVSLYLQLDYISQQPGATLSVSISEHMNM